MIIPRRYAPIGGRFETESLAGLTGISIRAYMTSAKRIIRIFFGNYQRNTFRVTFRVGYEKQPFLGYFDSLENGPNSGIKLTDERTYYGEQ
jgi:hypothetical protein